DLRNVNLGGPDATSREQAHVVVDINGFLGGQGQPEDNTATEADPKERNAVKMSITLAAHEVGHTVGMIHGNAQAPVGRGIHLPPGAGKFLPPYPGVVDAFESTQNIMASPASVGSTLTDTVSDPYFGARSLVTLAFNASWTDTGANADVVHEAALSHTSPLTLTRMADGSSTVTGPEFVSAGVVGNLVTLNVPNTQPRGVDKSKVFDV